MTRLALPLEACEATEPYVLRVEPEALTRADGRLTIAAPEGRAVIDPADEDLTGDVIGIFPAQKRLVRFLRAGRGAANTLLLTEACDQRCVMCSQPPRPRHYDDFALYDRVIDLAPAGAVIGLSGGEPSLLADALLPWMLRVVERRPDIAFHILSNGQHLTEAHGADLAALGTAVLWGVPLYAARASEHDALVGKPGAFDRLLESLELLRRSGALVELRSVVAAPVWDGLPRLAAFAARHLPWVERWALMHLEYRGYAKANWGDLFVDTGRRLGPLRTAAAIAEVAGLSLELFNFPRCTLPPDLRRLAVPSISDWKQAFPAACSGCRERAACGGFFTWQADRHGFTGVHAL